MPRRVYRYAGRDWPDPRSTRAWRALRDQVVAEEPRCQLAYDGICTRRSQTADHIVPVVERPDLGMTRTNLRGACHACNGHRNQLSRRRGRPGSKKPRPRPTALRFFD